MPRRPNKTRDNRIPRLQYFTNGTRQFTVERRSKFCPIPRHRSSLKRLRHFIPWNRFGSGFYLTDNSEEAKNTTAKPALLVFQLNRQEHLTDSEKLSLFNDERRWCEIVTSFWSGVKTARTRKSLAAYDLIEGPVSTMKTNESTGDLVFTPKPLSYQMCLISDSCADIFRRSLYSILFFDIC